MILAPWSAAHRIASGSRSSGWASVVPASGIATGTSVAPGATPWIPNCPGRPTMIEAIEVPWPYGSRSRSVRPSPPSRPKSTPAATRPVNSGNDASTPVSISAIRTPCPRAPPAHSDRRCHWSK